jgi:two-component system NtrC family sensor kinase
MREPPARGFPMNRPEVLNGAAEARGADDAAGLVRIKPTLAAERALKERPVFSIRLQVYFSVFFLFAIVLAIGLLTSATTSRVEREVHLYEVTSKFLFEVDQARRFEKDFFLYGTNLDDALEQVHSARRILRENADRFTGIVGQANYNQINTSLDGYEDRLTSLTSIKREDRAGLEQIRNAEIDVRKSGRDIVTFASDLVERERGELEKMISFSRHVQLYLLIFLLLYMVAMSYMLIRRIVGPIGRYMEYLERIARGDYSPILPRRRYRDEFSALAIAINHMVEELGHRESVLVESHKLRAVGTLTAGVAHELNNPINNITLTSHLLLEDYASLPDAERNEMINDIIHEAERTKKIVGSLLDFTRQSESKVEPIDLAEVVKKTLALSQNQLHLKGVRVTLEVAPFLPLVHGDSQQLSQVVLNLVLNAVDASPKGGIIEVSVRRAKDENYVEIRVKDHGPGIPSHVLPLIFDPFFTTKPKGKGVGLGLSICKGILSRHGGELTVETEAGKGATFSVHLPVTSFPVDFSEMKEELEKRGAP